MTYSSAKSAAEDLTAWTQGRTGYPMVDAGMRQLLAQGWMHNRLRMLVVSFLVKDLHQEWTRGARWFMQHLVDGDLASIQHGWQWDP
jgi:deoxyribodipyrimidine photo-lyase